LKSAVAQGKDLYLSEVSLVLSFSVFPVAVPQGKRLVIFSVSAPHLNIHPIH